MNLEHRSIIGRGDLKNERITFRAKSALDVGDYVLLQCVDIGGEPSTTALHAFWFPYGKINDGDLVVLYTKEGSSSSKKLSTGATAHFFYWGFSETIWDREDLSAVILLAPTWAAKPARDLDSEKNSKKTQTRASGN